MSKVKCGGCGECIEKDTAVRYGIQNFCPDSDCRRPKPRKTTTKPAKAPKRKADIDPALRILIAERDGGCCRRCGTSRNIHLHHIVLRSQGGLHVERNLVSLCMECHALMHQSTRYWQPILLAMMDIHYTEHTFATVSEVERLMAKRDDQSSVSVSES